MGWGQRITIIHPHCLNILKHHSAARQRDAVCCNYPWWVILDKLILRRFKTFRNGCWAAELRINIWIRLQTAQTSWKIGPTFKILLISFSWLSADKKWNGKRNIICQFILIRIFYREQFWFWLNVFLNRIFILLAQFYCEKSGRSSLIILNNITRVFWGQNYEIMNLLWEWPQTKLGTPASLNPRFCRCEGAARTTPH